MLQVLPAVATESCFALKGGTAINFFVRDLARLSVDIDLAFLPLLARTDALSDIAAALQRVDTALLRTMPATVVQGRGTPMAPKRLLKVDRQPVKIEPNPVLRGTVFPPDWRRLSPAAEDLFEMSVEVAVVSHADLYAGKLCAALDRGHPRDWFDVYLLLENEGLTDALRQAFVVYLASHDRPMSELLAPSPRDFRDLYEREFVGMTREPVALATLDATQKRLPMMLRNALTGNERAFLLSIKQGAPDWQRLPIPHLDQLPALRWKLANIEKLRQTPKKHAASVDNLGKLLDI